MLWNVLYTLKYNLPKNSAIVADSKQELMYEDLINTFEIDYSAGGGTQNTFRFVQWILGKNRHGIAAYMGCIGNDYFGRMMEKKAKGDGVRVLYNVEEGVATGTCAVLITDHGKNRANCAYLGAAERLTKEHLVRHWHWVEKAKVFYVSGHSIKVTADSVIALAHQVIADKYKPKIFCFNLGAPYVSEKYGPKLMEVIPYVHYLFGNEFEAAAFAKFRGYQTSDMKEIAKKIADEESKVGKRTVVITQAANPVLVARSGESKVDEYPVPQLEPEKVLDTNGAGDAFTGGFLAMFIQEKPFDVCIKCAIYCATECIQKLGVVFPREYKFKP
ncbi:adenosine kinase-like protein [Leptotrombidium deliense]|uniref:Adenosine kinase n=1 Tax=Leptotrombidium deliense TaxID=299467 RepID=A0A443SRC3_9ACAR|nr:adenosine kinase-like protein [Leptotrombidium deliense]